MAPRRILHDDLGEGLAAAIGKFRRWTTAIPADEQKILKAIDDLFKAGKRPVRLSDVAGRMKGSALDVLAVIEKLQGRGLVYYTLMGGYAVEYKAAKSLLEYGERSVITRTIWPISYPVAPFSEKQVKRLRKAAEERQRIRDRMRELALEAFPRRMLNFLA